MQESKFKSSNSLSIRVTSFVDSLDLKKSYFLIQKILNFRGLIISSIHYRNKATKGIKNFVIALCLKKIEILSILLSFFTFFRVLHGYDKIEMN